MDDVHAVNQFCQNSLVTIALFGMAGMHKFHHDFEWAVNVWQKTYSGDLLLSKGRATVVLWYVSSIFEMWKGLGF